jgi:hypothetical protein
MIPVAVAVMAIVIVSYFQGVYVERNDLLFPWGRDRSPERDLYISRIDKLPMNFGDWIGKDTEHELDERVKKIAGIEGRVSRTYRNTRTNEEVSVEIVSGLPQHISEHTPDRCYVSNGYEMTKDDQTYTVNMVNGDDAQFRLARFRKESHDGGRSRLLILWSWRTSESKWIGPSVFGARFEFAGKPALYKIYVIDSNPIGGRPESESPAVSFVEEALPQIDAYLSGTASDLEEPADGEPASE